MPKFINKIAIITTVFLQLVICAGIAYAQGPEASNTPWYETPQNRLRLIAEQTSIAPDQSEIWVGLQFELEPHWHIYWRSPGEAGLPPTVDWAGSQNVAQTEMSWPTPVHFEFSGIHTVGYTDTITLPVRVKLAEAGTPLNLKAQVEYLICEEICIPYTADFNLTLPAGDGQAGEGQSVLEAARQQVPLQGSQPQLRVEGATVSDDNLATITVGGGAADKNTQIFVEAAPNVVMDPPKLVDSKSGKATFGFALRHVTGESLDGQALTITATGQDIAIEQDVTLMAGGPASAAPMGMLSVGWVLLLGLMGGAILNLMPCVLPVLSLKLLKVVKQAGEEAVVIRRSFLWTTAGIFASFLLLAVIAIGLRQAGMVAGWGVQFQQPLFLIFMLLILLPFSANLWGLFEIPLPAALANRLLQAETKAHGHASHFLTGAFATLLATPCTAPFLGTAVGFALSAAPIVILATFMAIALGFSLPYLLVAARPKLISWMPKPGGWMVAVRKVLAVMLLLTSCWLFWVLSLQIGHAASIVLAALFAMGAALMGVYPLVPKRLHMVVILALVALAVSLFIIPPRYAAQHQAQQAAHNDLWQDFQPDEIAALVAEGRIVFVDLTASWCLTCQINKSVATTHPDVEGWMQTHNVVAMRGDWTQPDPVIANYLQQHGRAGIPFNIVFGPGLPDGEILPEVLTPGRVLDAFERAQ